jgi:hypothetical protein
MPMPMDDPPAPLSWGRAFTTWRFVPIAAAVPLVAPLLYLAAVVAVRRRGVRRPAATTRRRRRPPALLARMNRPEAR